jgi:hypothetical protein
MPLLLCVTGAVVSCGSSGTTPAPTNQPSNPSSSQPAAASVAGNWMTPSGSTCCGLALFQSNTSLTALLSNSICGLTTLQGSVTGSTVNLTGGNGALSITATASISATGGTLSGTQTCGVATSPFSATLVGNISGQWTGTFTAISLVNTGVKTNVTLSISENPTTGNFPTLSGTATFSTPTGSPTSCLASAVQGPITLGFIEGTFVSLQVTSAVFNTGGVPVSIIGTTDTTGHVLTVTSYSARCGPAPLDSTEAGIGTLSRQ